MAAPGLPSVDDHGPVRLIGDQGFTAEIERDAWLLIGGQASVERTVNRRTVGPWPGTVDSFNRAWAMVSEWQLASGDLRSTNTIVPLADGWPVGHTHPVQMNAYSWTATVTEAVQAIEVRLRFTIQSGAVRRRPFYVLGELDFFGTLVNDGETVEVRQLGPAALPS